jgi:hypothetical protein
VFSLQDGSCLATINAEHVHIKPPDGIKDRDVSPDVLVWSHLEVYRVGEVREVSSLYPFSLTCNYLLDYDTTCICYGRP